MNELFVDTSAWVAMNDAADAYHGQAMAFMRAIAGQYLLITTNYILDETYTLMLRNVGLAPIVGFKRKIDQLESRLVLKIIWVDATIDRESWEAFEHYNTDKQWSYTDCVSFVVMNRREVARAFTFDHHFEQMGFLCYPQRSSSRTTG